MTGIQIPLTIASVVFILFILIFYLFIRKKLKNYKEVDRGYIKKEIKRFNFIIICSIILIILSIFIIFINKG